MVEIASAFFGLIQGILILLKRKENWIFYMLNISTLIVYSFSVKLYGDVIENLIYFVIGILGILSWANTTFSKKFHVKIRYASFRENVIFACSIFIISFCIWFIVSTTDDVLPVLDAITTGMGFVATYMMAMKIIESWIVWFVDDILMAITYLSLPNSGYFLAALNFIWIFMAVGSYISWRKEITNENV